MKEEFYYSPRTSPLSPRENPELGVMCTFFGIRATEDQHTHLLELFPTIKPDAMRIFSTLNVVLGGKRVSDT